MCKVTKSGDRQVWENLWLQFGAVGRWVEDDFAEAAAVGSACILASSLWLLGGGSEEHETRALQHPS